MLVSKKTISWLVIGIDDSLFEIVKQVSVNRKNIKKLKHNIKMPNALYAERLSTLLTSKLICELFTRP